MHAKYACARVRPCTKPDGDSGMSINGRIAAGLIAVTASVFVYSSAVLTASGGSDDTSVGPPPALPPGQAPPVPKAGPLAQPRSQVQVGFPAALTASVI